MDQDRPATYRDVFAVAEWRWMFGAQTFSLIGDQLARVALTVLVFRDTGSALLTSLVFALTFLPWVVGGPALAVLADRWPRLRVMVVADLLRTLLVLLLATPGLPLPVACALVFCVTLVAAPFEAARSALQPEVLTGDRYVVGAAICNINGQVAQVAGFAAGGVLVALLSPSLALVLNAATFAVSAMLLQVGLRRLPAAGRAGGTSHLTARADIATGFHFVFRAPMLRQLALLAWIGAAFSAIPEGLAAPYAASLGGGAGTVGLLLAANPLGAVIGAAAIARLVAPARRVRLMVPLAVLACGSLAGFLLRPSLEVALGLLVLSGIGGAFQLPANALFVTAVPPQLRGRAFGLVACGLYAGQGAAILAAGALAVLVPPAVVIGLGGLAGAALVVPLGAALRDSLAPSGAPDAAGTGTVPAGSEPALPSSAPPAVTA